MSFRRLKWSRSHSAAQADWLALDDRVEDFQAHADRLLAGTSFDRPALVDTLHALLLQRAACHEAVLHIAFDTAAPRQSDQVVDADHGEAAGRAVSAARTLTALPVDRAAARWLPLPFTP